MESTKQISLEAAIKIITASSFNYSGIEGDTVIAIADKIDKWLNKID